MPKIKAVIGLEKYKVEIESPEGVIAIADESIASGGQGLGLAPREMLCASLGACTVITLRMYCDRKGWELQSINIDVELKRDEVTGVSYFYQKLELEGNLNEEQRKRIMTIANACPVHKILANPITIETELL